MVALGRLESPGLFCWKLSEGEGGKTNGSQCSLPAMTEIKELHFGKGYLAPPGGLRVQQQALATAGRGEGRDGPGLACAQVGPSPGKTWWACLLQGEGFVQ